MFKSMPGQADQYEGIQVYKIKGDELEGPFVLFDGKDLGHEKLKKLK